MSNHTGRIAARLLALVAGAALLAGCGGGKKAGELPATFPVKGKVTDAKGTPLKGGMVQFDSGKPGDLTVVGVIGADGAYTVKSFRDKAEAAGARRATTR